MAAAFQRTASSVTVLSTTSVGTLSTCQVGTLSVVEIANLSTTTAAAFSITPAGQASGTASVATDRVIPPDTVLIENTPLGVSFVSAIALSSPGPTIVFTPGQLKELP